MKSIVSWVVLLLLASNNIFSQQENESIGKALNEELSGLKRGVNILFKHVEEVLKLKDELPGYKEKIIQFTKLLEEINQDLKLKSEKISQIEKVLNERKDIVNEYKKDINRLSKDLQKLKGELQISKEEIINSLSSQINDLRCWYWINLFISTLAFILAILAGG
jgi:uncharacterized protein (DUF3084 family)